MHISNKAWTLAANAVGAAACVATMAGIGAAYNHFYNPLASLTSVSSSSETYEATRPTSGAQTELPSLRPL